jgi:hypothetical protein
MKARVKVVTVMMSNALMELPTILSYSVLDVLELREFIRACRTIAMLRP